ncbi:helix-turn-helix domain-containing protein [Glycomyces albidus]|uniref:Helix-turn-helix domain-containing protein n=1 Tax=Glycomyces albidus TaxID=2656774 RepID=A0A6L5GC79_9ACTN|nr:helix-turn-helix transcriptional regulator [Glycomyces albidus]MQM27274.1 helix-turn-helix domain-containing protein [Glycomyces albidus]
MAAPGRFYPRLAQHLLAEFTGALRELRERAGLPTFRAMSRRTGVSAATLWRAESGDSYPTLLATIAYVEACDGDQQLWEEQHHDLMLGLNGSDTAEPVVFVPWRDYFDQAKPAPPPTVKTLRKEMRRLWVASGLTLREISERTKMFRSISGEYGIGVSTISELCNPDQVRVPRRRTLHGFLQAVEAEPRSIERWLAARNQLAAKQDPHLEEPQRLPLGVSSAKPVVVPTAAGESVVDPGQQLLARFRRLRKDLASPGKASSPPRVARVLQGLGVDERTANQLAQSPTYSSTFVMQVDQTMHKVMTEGRLSSSGAPLALELAIHRVVASFQQHLERSQSARDRERDQYRGRELRAARTDAPAREAQAQEQRAGRTGGADAAKREAPVYRGREQELQRWHERNRARAEQLRRERADVTVSRLP